MSTKKVSELTGAELDRWVAKAEGFEPGVGVRSPFPTWVGTGGNWMAQRDFAPSTDWRYGGQIIERERIAVIVIGGKWRAFMGGAGEAYYFDVYEGDESGAGETALIAAMRAYVRSKFGETVEV